MEQSTGPCLGRGKSDDTKGLVPACYAAMRVRLSGLGLRLAIAVDERNEYNYKSIMYSSRSRGAAARTQSHSHHQLQPHQVKKFEQRATPKRSCDGRARHVLVHTALS
eukprot:scpid108381/ scgid31095/ 